MADIRNKFLSFSLSRRTVFFILLLSVLIFLLQWRYVAFISSDSSETYAANQVVATTTLSKNIKAGLGSVSTNNYANRKLEYYYFFPSKLLKQPQISHPVLVIVPGLSGSGRRAVSAAFRQAAMENDWIILAPSFIFDGHNWETATSYQFPAAWSGQALLDIMQNFSWRQHLKIGRLFLHGVSAGAQFVVRFALWQPELCLAVSAQAGGGTIIPVKFIAVKFFISIGRLDTTRMRQFNGFLEKAAQLGIAVESKIYAGGHGLPAEQILDSIRFFENSEKYKKNR